MRVVVTGASGHIGSHLLAALVAEGVRPTALVHEEPLGGGEDDAPVELVRGDVLDPASLDRAFAGAELVFHLAARISIDGQESERSATERVNVEGTRNVVRSALRAGARRLLHFSSIHALSPFPADRPVDEERPLVEHRAAPHYDRSKAESEREVHAGIAAGLDAVIVNPTGVIGPLDFRPSEMGAVLLGLYRREFPALI